MLGAEQSRRGQPVGIVFPLCLVFFSLSLPTETSKAFNLLPGWGVGLVFPLWHGQRAKRGAPRSGQGGPQHWTQGSRRPRWVRGGGLGEVGAGFAAWVFQRCQETARDAGKDGGICPDTPPPPQPRSGGGHTNLSCAPPHFKIKPLYFFPKHTRSSLCQPVELTIICTKNFRFNRASKIKPHPR